MQQSKNRRVDSAGVKEAGMSLGALRASWAFHCAADVDEVIGDHAEPDPALHSCFALVSAAIEPMPPFDHADAALASGSPFLAVAEPTLLLFALALGALGGAIGDRDAFDAHRLGCRLVLGGVECRVRRHQMRHAAQHR